MFTAGQREALVAILAGFEVGRDLSPGNPLAESDMKSETNTALAIADFAIPFLEGGAVPDTAEYGNEPLDFALAGFLQGLSAGYELALVNK